MAEFKTCHLVTGFGFINTGRSAYANDWQHIHTNDLPYNPLFDQGYRSVGCAPCTRPVAHGHERAGRWIGRTKTECGLHLES